MTQDKPEAENALVSLGVIKADVKIDVGPLKNIADKYGRAVLRRVGPIVNKEIDLFRQRQAIRELENLSKFDEKFEQIKAARGLPDEEPTPAIADPIIDAAANEERTELRNLWAKLLAAAIDPERKSLVRASLISAAKHLEPIDAAILERLTTKLQGRDTLVIELSERLGASDAEILVSLSQLCEIGLAKEIGPPHNALQINLTPLGDLFRSAVED